MTWREKDHPRDEDGRFTDSWVAAVSDQMGSRRYWGQYCAGRDLVASGYAEKAKAKHQRGIKEWEEQSWPYGDPVIEDLAREQGFDGLPVTGTPDELDEAVRAGGIEIWRGYGPVYLGEGQTLGEQPPSYQLTLPETAPPPIYQVDAGGLGAAEQHMARATRIRQEALDNTVRAIDQWRDGQYKAGHGVYGNGTYTSGSFEAARAFGMYGARYGFPSNEEGARGSVQRMVLSPDARVYIYGEDPEISQWGKPNERDAPMLDPGRMLTAWGYDAMLIPHGEDDGTGLDAAQYVIFNRTALLVEEGPGAP